MERSRPPLDGIQPERKRNKLDGGTRPKGKAGIRDDGSRTHTGRILSPLTLPVGLHPLGLS